jgi:hypothetical protein
MAALVYTPARFVFKRDSQQDSHDKAQKAQE